MADGDIAATIALSLVVTSTLQTSDVVQGAISFSPVVAATGQTASAINGAIQISPQITMTGLNGHGIDAAIVVLLALSSTIEAVDEQEGMAVVLPVLGADLQGVFSELGELAVSFPNVGMELVGVIDEAGTLDVVLPGLEFALDVDVAEQGDLAMTLPAMSWQLSARDNILGDLALTFPAVLFELSGIVSELGDLAVTFPGLQMELGVQAGTYLSMVMNLRNRGLTEYDHYPFNSMCRFEGKHLATDGTKIVDLDGTDDTDDGALIDWHFRTGYLDQERKSKKRLRQAWISLKTDGNLIVSVVQPDGNIWTYTAESYEQTETGIRVKVGKGLKSKYVALDFASEGGSKVELDAIRLHLDEFREAR